MLREGNVELSLLSQRFRPALMAFFLRRIRNHAEAEDLTQDVLARLASHASTIDPARPDAYVFQTAANLLRDRWRRAKIRAQHEAGGPLPIAEATLKAT